ncbi:AbiV family abortive infection protein [Pseudomonas sp. NFACC36]|uniref:AbiV family abortive infection protein n=1 Tax=Pseudomonas sp. NFACC36 TaxID=1566197 RepID=UPI00091DC4EF|nr:AbiV family abortive infection protein [Pseudomonas sp. NFACC36]SFY12235.1 abortive infection protein, AbiV family [Pseudomonas sp. NFACC36]
MSLSSDSLDIAKTLIDGAAETFSNAEALFTEATILANERAWARALFLHQISLEECAKIEMLGAAVVSLLRGMNIELRSLQRAFSRHESKNKTNAYFLPQSEVEKDATINNRTADAVIAFKAVQEEFHQESNSYKNSSLYVDFKEVFTSPLKTISEEDFVKVRERNEVFMSISCQKIELLARWGRDLDEAALEVADAIDVFGIDKIDRESGESILSIRAGLEEKIQELLKKRKA